VKRLLLPRLLLLLLLAPLAAGLAACRKQQPGELPPLDVSTGAFAPLERTVSFDKDVKPVLESRCVVCHACYDAPCQLLLSSPEGAERGATKQTVYDASRLKAAPPTRMFVDARSTEEWRAREFFSVLSPEDPLLLSMLALGRAHPPAEGQKLPPEVELDIDRTLSCPAPGEFQAYAREHPRGGMPYGTAPLRDQEIQMLATWVKQGAAAPPPPEIPARARQQVDRWEAFLNGDSLKERILGRYLYEHWFVAHLRVEGYPQGPFFEVVRSRTPPGQAIDVIATVRPFDDPGTGTGRVYYRLRPIHSSIVHKTHIVYPLTEAKRTRLRELFLDTPWAPTRLPSYQPEEASNPFLAFDQMPARSRYQFLLDDAHYFIMTFIRGPVCRGEVAVDVIEDQFWVAFLAPERDLSVQVPDFLQKAAPLLALPAEHAEHFEPGELWLEYARKQRKYLELRESYYDQLDPERKGPALDWVWDGEQRNPNARLTVFRNFDNATVVKGFIGAFPKTAWIMDYPIFERIYYNLVAGFDIYGNLVHQVSTRLYMDHLRMQSENLFLTFLPADQREQIRASWYLGATRNLTYAVTDKLRALDHGTQIPFKSPDPKAEFLEMLIEQAGPAAGPADPINRCGKPPCDRPTASADERAVERELQRLTTAKGGFVALLPEVSFLRVTDTRSGTDLLYALVHNDDHSNVAFMFGEDERRLPEDDTLTVVRGHFGSYPNFSFEVEADDIDDFVSELSALRSEADLERFAGRYGIRRSSERFWETVDWLHADLRRRDPTQAGLYDFARYGNL
jgi:hypothetical protein